MEQKKYIVEVFDKFDQKTITRTLPLNKFRDQTLILWSLETNENHRNYSLAANIRHIKSPKTNSLMFDFDLIGDDWFFFREGKLYLVIDFENIEIHANESYTEVNPDGLGGIREGVYYLIDQEILNKICSAKDFSIRISGTKFIDLDDNASKSFQIMCKRFYNNFYDSKIYEDELEKKETSSERESKYFLELANYISLGFVLLWILLFIFIPMKKELTWLEWIFFPLLAGYLVGGFITLIIIKPIYIKIIKPIREKNN